MTTTPVLLRFPDRATTIPLLVVLSESSYGSVFGEIVNAKGRQEANE